MSWVDRIESVLSGLVIAAVLVLSGCQEAMEPLPANEKFSIEGEWTVSEYARLTPDAESQTLSSRQFPPPFCPAGWTSVRTWHTKAPSDGSSYLYHRECHVNLADEQHDITMIFTADTWVMTFDPPLPGVSEAGAAAVISGSYEFLSDSRILLVFERPIEEQIVSEHSVSRSGLTFKTDGKLWLAARRM